MRFFFLLLMITACGKGGGGDGSANGSRDRSHDKQILADYATKVVIPTYQEFSTRATALGAAIAAFDGARTEDNLKAVRQAWSATRSPWEQSEAFLFGPVEDNGFDNAVDSWPLNHTDLEGVLGSGQALTDDLVGNLPNNQKGFHTAEFLIYGQTSDKAAGAFNDREIAYLKADVDNIQAVAAQLAKSWSDGLDGKPSYQTIFTTAGDAGNTKYPSVAAALQDMIKGMSSICHEVGESKIATPADAKDPNQVESQFSFNSLLDFADNVRSVQNAYLAAFPDAGTTGTAFASVVAGADPAADAEVRQDITDAINAIKAIPAPFPVTLKDPANAPAIKAAEDALAKLQSTLDKKILPIASE